MTQFAMGIAMAQQMAQQAGGILNQSTPPAGAVPPPLPASSSGGLPELMTPADAAKALGVTEADVLEALSDGSLKGKKIGSAWRITKSAFEEFLKH
jgi:excisionase family DNA binding protein